MMGTALRLVLEYGEMAMKGHLTLASLSHVFAGGRHLKLQVG